MGNSVALQSGKGSGKHQLLTLDDLDGRTRAYKQTVELRAGFLSDLGGEDYATVAQRELAQRGAVLGAMLEDQEAKWLAGVPVELDKYCTLVNAQRRVLADMGLERRQRDVTPDLSDYLEAKAAE
jgi:predicted ABC-type transport system involved in lysophospholipase L1 biosynthesis ATPase subunit